MGDAMIARGSAGDCCILCGKVGINLPDEHGCVPNAVMPERGRWDWNERFLRHEKTSLPDRPAEWIDTKTGEVLPQPPPRLMAARLAGIARKMAEATEGERNTVLHWCWRRLVEQGHPPEAWNVVAAAARTAGLPESEIYTTLRYGRGVAS
jgi:hypothetical protein